MKIILKILVVVLFTHTCFAQKRDSVYREKKTAWILSSNFNLPTVQFSPYSTKGVVDKTSMGQISFFNSLGAGISLSKADFNLLTAKDDTTGTDIKNHIGVQGGFLFSKASGETKDISRFALYAGISILDFQIGIGKEFGDRGVDLSPRFYTISYSIPMSKFLKNTTLVFRNKGGQNFGKKISKVGKAFTI